MNIVRRIRCAVAILAVAFTLGAVLPAEARMPARRPSGKVTVTGRTPDFSMPKQVIADSRQSLGKALKSRNYPAVVRSVADIALATGGISTDSVPGVISLIGTTCAQVADPAAKAMLHALEARLYADIYSANRYVYDQRVNLGGTGDDYTLWSRDRFAACVDSLVTLSLTPAAELQATPLDTYRAVVDFSRDELTFYPTLYDFVARQGVENLMVFDNGENILNARLVDNPGDTALYPAGKPLMHHILTIYNDLARFHADRAAALVDVNLSRLGYISDHVYDLPAGALAREYLALYGREAGQTDQAVRYLLSAPQVPDSTLYRMLGEFKAAHAGYADMNAVTNRLNSLAAVSAEVSYRSLAVPGVPFKVMLSGRNSKRTVVSLYDISSYRGGNNESSVKLSAIKSLLTNPVATHTFECDRAVPFAITDSVMMTCPRFGRYVVIVEGSDGAKPDTYVPVLVCSGLALATIGGDSDRLGIVVNPVTGEPQKDVSLEFSPWSRRTVPTAIPGVTDADGILGARTKENGSFRPVSGDDRYSLFQNGSSWYDYRDTAVRYEAAVVTSLGLYHPGDTVQFAVVLSRVAPDGVGLEPDRTVKVILRDANYQEAGSVTVTTDAMGRAEGAVTLPDAGLQGRFSLVVEDTVERGRQLGATGFEVSDYRLPTFRVADLKILPPATPADSAVVTGQALTYAGFPVADARVAVSLQVRRGFWRWSPTTPVFATVDGTTDAAGNIRVVIPAEVMASSPVTDGYFTATVAVTSADGETQQSQAGFNPGKPMYISCVIPSVINTAAPFKADVNAVDHTGATQPMKMTYTLRGENAEGPAGTFSGSFDGGLFNEVIRVLPVGRYNLTVEPMDSTLADPVKDIEFIVYTPDAKVSPVKSAVWLPDNRVVADAAGEARIPFASGAAGSKVLVIISTKDSPLHEKRWITTEPGMQEIKIHLDGDAQTVVQLFAVKDFSRSGGMVTVMPASSRRAIDLKVETFRDKVTPGDAETVTFKVTPREGASASAAVMASLTNAAINQLAPVTMSVAFSDNSVFSTPWLSGWRFFNNSTSAMFRAKTLATLDYGQPSWQFYNRLLYGGALRIRGSRMYAANAAVAMDAMESVEEVADLNVVREHKSVLREAPVMAAGATAKQEVAEEAEADEVADAGEAGATTPEEVTYRPSEIPLAFFCPMLSTDSKGLVSMTYTVPQANTTWMLKAVAYNAEMLTATTAAEIVASKQVMVSLNAPSFLRGGDKVTVRASVMNNTDSAGVARGVIQVLSQADGTLLASRDFVTDTIAAAGTGIVAIDYEADPMVTAVIFRASATIGTHTDGEQHLTRIVPSQQDVVRSQMFYIPSDSTTYAVALDSVAAGGKAILQYTENPAWEVVTALPGLRENRISSSVEAAHTLFSARVADGLTRRFPEITRAIRRWAENPEDSMLVSNLQKNSELRQMLLSATPWVSEALDDTQRLQRLALLLDPRESDRVTRSALDILSKTAVSGGGWSWTASYPHVSEWATSEVLLTLGLLNQMGLMPDNDRLGRQVTAAWEYLDSETVKAFRKYPKDDYTTYVYTRGLYPSLKRSTAVTAVVSATVQRALAGWRGEGIGGKAVSASLLNANGYAATARKILESLRQYATVTPEKGMWWQQLDHESVWRLGRVGTTAMVLRAFAEIEPKAADIDRIRQWLVLQKQNTDWGSSAVTSLVVATILNTGADWAVQPRGTAIHIGDTLVEAPRTETYTGRETVNVTAMLAAPQVMTIDRRGGYPSCGAVVTMERLPMSAVKAVSCAEASIEKSVSVSHNGGVWMPTDTVSVGDRVLVTLTVRADDDLDYVVISDPRPAGCDLVSQLPEPVWSEGLCFYRENSQENTNLYIDHLRRGTYVLTYELFASRAGTFATGGSQFQSQYNPLVAAHAAGSLLKIKD